MFAAKSPAVQTVRPSFGMRAGFVLCWVESAEPDADCEATSESGNHRQPESEQVNEIKGEINYEI